MQKYKFSRLTRHSKTEAQNIGNISYKYTSYSSAVIYYLYAIKDTPYGAISSGDSQGLGTVVKALSLLA
jgi:hypothetical protein